MRSTRPRPAGSSRAIRLRRWNERPADGAEIGRLNKIGQILQQSASRPVVDEDVASELLQRAVHLDRAQAEDIGEHVLGQGKVEGAAASRAQTHLPFVQFRQQGAVRS